jgi:phosphoribosylamine--glycine ligase
MGTVSPATNLTLEMHKEIMQTIVLPTIAGMASEGRRYQGVLYVGLMITAEGPRVLEFNARFGDPEAQVILARLRSDIVPTLLGVAQGQLSETKLEWTKEPAVCVVLASKGYPETSDTGKLIGGLESLKGPRETSWSHHAARALQDGKLVTIGGRVLSVRRPSRQSRRHRSGRTGSAEESPSKEIQRHAGHGRKHWRACTQRSRRRAPEAPQRQ